MEFGKVLKKIKTKTGIEVIVQMLAESDLPLLVEFINELTSEDTYIYRDKDKPVTLDEEKEWLKNTIAAMDKDNQAYFVAKAEGKIIGGGNIIRGWMREQEQGRFRISIAKEYREQGVGTEMMQIGLEVAKEMGLNLLHSWIFSDDSKGLYLAKKMGFIEAGKLPQSIRFKNGYVDQVLVYKKLDEEYNPKFGVKEEPLVEASKEIERMEDDIV